MQICSKLLLKQISNFKGKICSSFRYYQNVCTAGYSSAWWQWSQWEKNIDWMALNGINLALAFHAQEAIWEKVYMKFNLTKEEARLHFGGPAFLPWSRMGNIQGWGGPLSDSWHTHTIELQHLILNRMRELGIIPVLPAFAGHVPRDFIRIFPNAHVINIKQWNNFEDEYCCPYMLDPTDPLFQTVGQDFLKMYIDEFGTSNIYNCDSFNENDPHRGDPEYLSNTGKAIFKAMSSVDPNAIWLMQGWLFVHSADFWTMERVKAFVTSVPIGRMIVLDLQSEQFPQYEKFQSYFGQPFIWCMLHNFGGTLGMFGSSGIINERVFAARQINGSTMIGTGLTPEGINQNYVIYDLMSEMSYRQKPVDINAWFVNYAVRRYGFANDCIKIAWQKLGNTIYNYSGVANIRGQYVITKRPSLHIKPWYWYDLKSFLLIWGNFIKADNETTRSNLFKHDIVDITRQALQLTADFIYNDIKEGYKLKNITHLQSASLQLLELYNDLEEILSSCKDFLLGVWLNDARILAPTDDEQLLENYEFNARNQITLWGPNGEIVDYANKQWSGVVHDYFRPRWVIFLKELENAVNNHNEINERRIRQMIFNEVELPFSYSRKLYPTEAKGDSIQIAIKLYNKWQKIWKNNV
ncbi:PREDICTED: alpha-N-acetylglucosaminidase [Ceratosolen solmsi marchali]|uniref:Alpha-N-acetylglucosaminidase n=1 Tax=Ceratosolen solmsi marchali TaxID=326594 RepID=A0AAJ6YH79_9HYME|nr:PREDICTED: alpha-N-acetylglucosaminidase [Ceratosolen solmsi marchali]